MTDRPYQARPRGTPAPHIRLWRLRRSLTQAEVAQRANMHLYTYQRIEQRGRANPRYLRRVAEALDVPVTALTGLGDEPVPGA